MASHAGHHGIYPPTFAHAPRWPSVRSSGTPLASLSGNTGFRSVTLCAPPRAGIGRDDVVHVPKPTASCSIRTRAPSRLLRGSLWIAHWACKRREANSHSTHRATLCAVVWRPICRTAFIRLYTAAPRASRAIVARPIGDAASPSRLRRQPRTDPLARRRADPPWTRTQPQLARWPCGNRRLPVGRSRACQPVVAIYCGTRRVCQGRRRTAAPSPSARSNRTDRLRLRRGVERAAREALSGARGGSAFAGADFDHLRPR